jgi:hypothetical protein
MGMRHVKFGGNAILVPESWADVTLERYNNALLALTEHQPIPRKAMAMAICALCGVRENALLVMSKEQVQDLRQALSFFFDSAPEPRLQMEFQLEGELFTLPQDIQTATFGEFVDLDTAIVSNKDDLRKAFPDIMAVYCRPKGETYNTPDLAERTKRRANLFKTMPTELAEGIAAFFLTSIEQQPIATSLYGTTRVQLVRRVRTLGNSRKPTGGWRLLRHWCRTMFLRWMRSRLNRAEGS